MNLKKIFAFLLIFALLLSATACRDSDNGDEGSSENGGESPEENGGEEGTDDGEEENGGNESEDEEDDDTVELPPIDV